MGNTCCAQTPTCDCKDEEQRLLNSSGSKTLASPTGSEDPCFGPLPLSGESKNQGENAGPETEVIVSQVIRVSESIEAPPQSSYSAVIHMLHTDASLASQANQSASPEVSKEPVEAATTLIEFIDTKNHVGTTGEIQTVSTEVTTAMSDSVKAPEEVNAVIVKEKLEGNVADVLVKQDMPAVVEPGKETAVNEEYGEDSEKRDVEVETNVAKPSLKNLVAQVDTKKITEADEKEAAEASMENTEAKMDTKKMTYEVKEEEEVVKTPTVSDENITQVSESTLNDSEVNKPMTLTDMSKNNVKTDIKLTENAGSEAKVCLAEPSGELNVEKNRPYQEVNEEHIAKPRDNMLDKCENNKGDLMLQPATQELSELNSSPVEETKLFSPTVENGKAEDLSQDEHISVQQVPQEASLATCEKPPSIESEPQESEPSSQMSSTEEKMEPWFEPVSKDMAPDQDKLSDLLDKEQEATISLLNGLDSSTAVEESGSSKVSGGTIQEDETKPDSEVAEICEVLGDLKQEDKETKQELRQEEKKETAIVVQEVVEKPDAESQTTQRKNIILSSSHAVEVALIAVNEKHIPLRTEQEQEEDEDLYRGAEEIKKELPEKQTKPILEFTIPGVEERSSLAPAVDILAYSEREWKGNTAKSALIRKGYSEMSCSFSGLRRVRGDNYCALRATFYQVLATTSQTPAWLLEEDFTLLPEKLEAQHHLIGGWTFPSECVKVGEKENAVEKLKHYLELLQKRWQAAAESESVEEKQRVCERVFQGGEEEYGLLEVLKLLMLARAVELHGHMEAGLDVPVFCWLLFARDTSSDPRSFLQNHLRQVGFTGGLEQVEMFLLGYALEHTVQAFRLYKTDTEEFVTHYPDDHKQDWPCVSVVTEDDRHYNVPVRKTAQPLRRHDIDVLLPHLS